MVKFRYSPPPGSSTWKGGISLDNAAEAAAFLYLMNQNTNSLSPAELYQLYTKTVKEIKAYAESKKGEENGFSYSIV